ncbi:MAG: HAMP domain-containing histidine kinase [Candidatus Melainabacteria bacterium]|nr:HAMP domain-containing histidine kinase [Candidatus Melainabacteria bacterium]
MAQLNLKISERGFLLVSIPLVFEIIFVTVLTSLITQAEAEMRREAHAKDVVRAVYKLQRDMLDCATAAGSYNLSKDTYSDQRFPLAQRWIKQDLKELDALVANSPGHAEKLQRVHRVAESGLKVFEDLKSRQAQAATLDSLIGTGAMLARVRSLVGQFGSATRDIVEEEERILSQSPVMQSQQRELVQKALIAGVGVNVILAIAMAMFFSKGITERLEVMTQNSLRVAKREPLNEPVEGVDEIAQLDRTFHKMVDDLNVAERQKQQLLQTVSHDLRSPLSSVRGTLTLLSAGAMGEMPEKALEKIRLAESDTERLIRLINDLLDLEKYSEGKGKLEFSDVPVKRLVERAANSVIALAERKGINISRAIDPVNVKGDEDRLVQIVVNLLSNAIKFSEQGGEIEIEAEAVSAGENGQQKLVEIAVADRGRGVPEELREKIFERFEQVAISDATESGGSGLGLAICKSIAELHGGSIGVRENPGGGSIFWFRIPSGTDSV